jgi:hypothetical protein
MILPKGLGIGPFSFSLRAMSDLLLHGEITDDNIGAFYDTYNALGWGYPESIYTNAMPIYLRRRGLQTDKPKALFILSVLVLCLP